MNIPTELVEKWLCDLCSDDGYWAIALEFVDVTPLVQLAVTYGYENGKRDGAEQMRERCIKKVDAHALGVVRNRIVRDILSLETDK